MKQRVFIILGMHRSGTSLLAAGLSHAGLATGDDLLGRTEANPKGHWEDTDCVALNNRVLAHLGLNWDALGQIDSERFQSKEMRALVVEGKGLLLRKLNENNGQFLFKDPRTIRVLPFWFEVLQTEELEVSFIFAFRNPLDVSASMAKRDNKPYAETQLLWLHHNLDGLRCLNDSNTDFVLSDFHELRRHPAQHILKLSKQLKLDCDAQKVQLFEEEFYDDKLISVQSSPFAVSTAPGVATICFDTFRNLRLWAAGESTIEQLQLLAEKWRYSCDLLIDFYQKTNYFQLQQSKQQEKSAAEEAFLNSLTEVNRGQWETFAKAVEALLDGHSESQKGHFETLTEAVSAINQRLGQLPDSKPGLEQETETRLSMVEKYLQEELSLAPVIKYMQDN